MCIGIIKGQIRHLNIHACMHLYTPPHATVLQTTCTIWAAACLVIGPMGVGLDEAMVVVGCGYGVVGCGYGSGWVWLWSG